jgi:hypothetical protein
MSVFKAVLKRLVLASHRGGPGSRPVTSCGIWSGHSGPGQVSSEYCGFPFQSSFHQILHPHNHPVQVQ